MASLRWSFNSFSKSVGFYISDNNRVSVSAFTKVLPFLTDVAKLPPHSWLTTADRQFRYMPSIVLKEPDLFPQR